MEETRPLSKLKRWRLKEIVRRTALVPEVADVDAARRSKVGGLDEKENELWL